ncbi:MAG: CBS domain-containing protein [Nitrososphaeraceae archaeon]|jgi:CBS domain-containing protein
MNVGDQLARLKVREVFAKRPFLFVYPDTKLLEVTTFLAIGPEIYVDGVVVVTEESHNGKKIQTPVGMIGGKNVLRSMLESTFDRKEDFFGDVIASQIMVEMTQSNWVELESPLSKVIHIFERTRFAFVPVINTIEEHNINKPAIIGTLTIRDLLPLIVNKKVHFNYGENEGNIKQISSPIVSVNRDSSIKDAISIMVKKGIRNIGIRNRHHNYGNENKEKGNVKENSSEIPIINDRKIIEFLLSHNRRAMSNPIFSSVSDLDTIQTRATGSNITIIEAAQYLMDIKNQFLVLEGNEYIVTPWDLIMKNAGNADERDNSTPKVNMEL